MGAARLMTIGAVGLLLVTGCSVSIGEPETKPTATVTVTASPTPSDTAPSSSPLSSTASPSSPTGTTTGETLSPPSPGPPATDLSRYELPGFTTPSGNIACLFDSYDGPHVRCDRMQLDRVPSGKPADCEFDWGHSVELSPGERGALACTSDSVMGLQGETDGSRELPYGDSVRYRGITCTSATDGVRCTSQGHGFLIARAAIRVY